MVVYCWVFCATRLKSVGTPQRKSKDASLLHGVSLTDCLSGWGKHFANSSAKSMYEIQKRDYGLSFQVSKIDHFLSHDWKTSRRRKISVMIVYFNARAATCAAALCAVFVGFCREAPWQDVEAATNYDTRSTDLTSLLPQATFVFFLCFWQRLRGLFRRPETAFLDRLCIAQHDHALKTQGILGLASFLDHSEELTILWSSRYFTRLWCCFEVAAFLRESQTAKNRQVTLLPAATAEVMVSLIAGNLFAVAFRQIQFWAASEGLWPPQPRTPSGVSYFGVAAIVACCFIQYLLLGLWTEIQDVNRQLREFSVNASDCFCCANHHRHPETGRTLLCDRALVFDALKTWYGKGEEEEHLDKFDREVQTVLRKQIQAKLATNIILPHSTLFLVLCGTLSPWLCDSVVWMKNLWLQSTDPMLNFWRCVVAVARFYFIPFIMSSFQVLIVVQVTVKLGFLLMVRVRRLVAAVLVGNLATVLVMAISWAIERSASMMGEMGLSDFWPFLALAWLLLLWILLMCLHYCWMSWILECAVWIIACFAFAWWNHCVNVSPLLPGGRLVSRKTALTFCRNWTPNPIFSIYT